MSGSAQATTINVQTYGATGNGSTDDKTAIQNAFNSCNSGDTVLFPAGTYNISGTLFIKSHCSYAGQGAPVLKGFQGTAVGGYPIFELDGNNGSANNVTITGLIFDGGGVFLQDTGGNVQNLVSNITIRNNVFRNIINMDLNIDAAQFGVVEDGGTLTHSTVDHNFFSHIADGDSLDNDYTTYGSSKYGVQIKSASYSNFDNNVFDWIDGDGIRLGEVQAAFDHGGLNERNNIFTRMHRNAIENQLDGQFADWQAGTGVGTTVSGNLAGHWAYPYWVTGGASAAGDGNILAKNNVWDGWNDTELGHACCSGYALELWGTGSVADGEVVLSRPAPAGSYLQWFYPTGVSVGHQEWGVPGTNRRYANDITIKNSVFCGGFYYNAYYALEGGTPAVTLINNSAPASCAGLFPSIPHNLSATPISANQVNLSWTGASDTAGVTGYNVYRNGDKIATVSGLSYSDTTTGGSNAYWYNIQAVDSAAKVGVGSDPAFVTTPAGSGTLPAPVITPNPDSKTATVGTPFTYTINASNSPTSYGAVIHGGTGLPPGLSLSGATLSGTPAQTGTWTLDLSATNATGAGTASLTLTVLPAGAANLASGIVPTAGTTASGPLAQITDGILDTNAYTTIGSGPQWIAIDLGKSYALNDIKVWHYYGDPRSYHGVVVQVSNDSTFVSGVTTVFNNDSANADGQGVGTAAEYAESAAGKDIAFSAVNARYVRLWSNGSTVNLFNHYVEVEVFGAAGLPPVCDVNGDGATNVVDVQQEVNTALGVTSCTSNYDVNKDGLCNVIDVQRVTNAALGGACVSP